nr:hypothetical protein [Candidatus Njordarchaeota archaeon]
MPRFLAVHEFKKENIKAVLTGGTQLVEAAAKGNLPEGLKLIWAFVAYPSRTLFVGLWEAKSKKLLEATFEPFKDVFKTEVHECFEVFPPGPDFVTFVNKFFSPSG